MVAIVSSIVCRWRGASDNPEPHWSPILRVSWSSWHATRSATLETPQSRRPDVAELGWFEGRHDPRASLALPLASPPRCGRVLCKPLGRLPVAAAFVGLCQSSPLLQPRRGRSGATGVVQGAFCCAAAELAASSASEGVHPAGMALPGRGEGGSGAANSCLCLGGDQLMKGGRPQPADDERV